MNRFELLEPQDLSEACSMLAEHRERARIIAGGHGLFPLLKHRSIKPSYLVNIRGISGLDYIRENGAGISIGALTTNRAVELSPVIQKRFPVLAELERFLGDTQTRNWGTLVGNLCMASPTSDPAPALIALNARLTVQSLRGQREVALEDFFVDFQKTALEADEIVLEVNIPQPPPHSGSAYHKERVRVTDSPIASVAAAVTLDAKREKVAAARIVLQAVCPTPSQAKEAAQLLVGAGVRDDLAIEKAAIAAAVSACPISDVYGSAEYKKAMVRAVTGQVVALAIERACAR